jgi:transcriptional regulator with XRE-family HTH domain
MLTELGKALRKLRIDRGWLLKEMADGIDVVPSFVSGVETGRKSVPADFVDRVIKWAKLSQGEADALRRAEAATRTEFRIRIGPDFSDADRETAAMLARFGDLPEKERSQIRRILVKKRV